jgi:14-3-3 protein epsilon
MEGTLLKQQLRMLIFTAKSLLKAEFYSHALVVIKNAIDMDPQLSASDQRLFFEIVRSNVAPLRTSLKQLDECQRKESRERHIHVAAMLQMLSRANAEKLELICQEVLSVITQQLLPGNPDAESKVDLMRLQGDLFRYIAEFSPPDRRDMYLQRCQTLYDEAMSIATAQLSSISLARLALVLNRSIFMGEVLHQIPEAIEFADSEYTKLTQNTVEVSEEHYQRAMLLGRSIEEQKFRYQGQSFKG